MWTGLFTKRATSDEVRRRRIGDRALGVADDRLGPGAQAPHRLYKPSSRASRSRNYHLETANSLIKAERQKNVPTGEAERLYFDFLTTQPVLCSPRPFVARGLKVALQTRAGLYDVFYVLLAQQEQCELVTADQRMINNLKHIFPFIHPLSSMP